jgi:amidase
MDTKVSREDLDRALQQLNMTVDDPELYCALVAGNLEVAALVDSVSVAPPPVEERAWQRPTDSDNPLGAWYVKTQIEGAAAGSLAGRTVAVKDTVSLAGVPTMCGTSILEGYTPTEDAEIVTRMLDAGATITGKTVCEAYCFSGGSHTSATGPVHNPYNPDHTTGGSSSGSGAAVAAGDVDMAIGCDQGGSIRVPSSYCGLVGMKPTCGLVA